MNREETLQLLEDLMGIEELGILYINKYREQWKESNNILGIVYNGMFDNDGEEQAKEQCHVLYAACIVTAKPSLLSLLAGFVAKPVLAKWTRGVQTDKEYWNHRLFRSTMNSMYRDLAKKEFMTGETVLHLGVPERYQESYDFRKRFIDKVVDVFGLSKGERAKWVNLELSQTPIKKILSAKLEGREDYDDLMAWLYALLFDTNSLTDMHPKYNYSSRNEEVEILLGILDDNEDKLREVSSVFREVLALM